eukprot:5072211-Alexandrium_andersonii.AAC.1
MGRRRYSAAGRPARQTPAPSTPERGIPTFGPQAVARPRAAPAPFRFKPRFRALAQLSLIHISEPTRLALI